MIFTLQFFSFYCDVQVRTALQLGRGRRGLVPAAGRRVRDGRVGATRDAGPRELECTPRVVRTNQRSHPNVRRGPRFRRNAHAQGDPGGAEGRPSAGSSARCVFRQIRRQMCLETPRARARRPGAPIRPIQTRMRKKVHSSRPTGRTPARAAADPRGPAAVPWPPRAGGRFRMSHDFFPYGITPIAGPLRVARYLVAWCLYGVLRASLAYVRFRRPFVAADGLRGSMLLGPHARFY